MSHADILIACPVEGKVRSALLAQLFGSDRNRRRALADAAVVPESIRCVQCGICSYNCPIGIDVRKHARLGKSIHSQRCITCGECIVRCPRGVLAFREIRMAAGSDRQGRREA